MTNCPRQGKWFGCKFVPRFDLSPADLGEFESIRGNFNALEMLRKKTYVRDVCVRCGKTIERAMAVHPMVREGS